MAILDFCADVYASLKNKAMWFWYYKNTYKNFRTVLKNQLSSNYPFEAILKNNKAVTIKSKDKAALYALLSKYKKFSYDEATDSVSFQLNLPDGQKKVRLFGVTQNLDALLVFSEDMTYSSLPVAGNIVVDIGACTADTAIYFAMLGARKIIAIEPYVKNYELAVKNIQENKLEDIIQVIMAGCGGTSKEIIVDPNYPSSMRSMLYESAHGVSVPIYTLEKIIKEFRISNAILKMDCEGCEYDTIINTNKEILQKFSHIQIEYHNGFKSLKAKLENAGFSVTKLFSDNTKRGHILATRN